MEIKGNSASYSPVNSISVPTISVEIATASAKTPNQYMVKIPGSNQLFPVMISGQQLQAGNQVELPVTAFIQTPQGIEKSVLSDHVNLADANSDQIFQSISGVPLSKVNEKLSFHDQKIVQTAMEILKDMPADIRSEVIDKVRNAIASTANESGKSPLSSTITPESSELVVMVRAILTELLDTIPEAVKNLSPEQKDRTFKLLTQLIFPQGSDPISQKGVIPLRSVPMETLLLPETTELIDSDSPVQPSNLPATFQKSSPLDQPKQLPREPLQAVIQESLEPVVVLGKSEGEQTSKKPNSSEPAIDISAKKTGSPVEIGVSPKNEIIQKDPGESKVVARTVEKIPITEPVLSKNLVEKSVATLTAVLKSEPLSLVQYATQPFEKSVSTDQKSAVTSSILPIAKPVESAVPQPLYQKIADKPSLQPEIIRFAAARFPTISSVANVQTFAELFSKSNLPLDEKRLIPLEMQLRAIPDSQRSGQFVKLAVDRALEMLAAPKGDTLFTRIVSLIEPVTFTVDRLAAIVECVKSEIGGSENPVKSSGDGSPLLNAETGDATGYFKQKPTPIYGDLKESTTAVPPKIIPNPTEKFSTQAEAKATLVHSELPSIPLIPKESGVLSGESIKTEPFQLPPRSLSEVIAQKLADHSPESIRPRVPEILSELKFPSIAPESAITAPEPIQEPEPTLEVRDSLTPIIAKTIPEKQLEISPALKESVARLETAVTAMESAVTKLFSSDSVAPSPQGEPLKKLGDSWGMFFESSLKQWVDGESKPELAGVKQELKRMNHIITKEMVVLAVPDKDSPESPMKSFLKDLGKSVTESIHQIEGGQILAKPTETAVDRSQTMWIPVQVGQEWTRMGIEFRREKNPKGKKGALGNHVAITMELKKMGEVSAELDLDANKQLRVKLRTSSPAALAWFKDHEEEIRASLQNEKLSAVLFGVSGIQRDSETPKRWGDKFEVTG